MVEKSLYVVVPIDYFVEKYDEYLEKGFVNRGGICYSNDGSLVLIEESPEMFSKSDLSLPGVSFFTQKEILEFLSVNSDDWEKDIDE